LCKKNIDQDLGKQGNENETKDKVKPEHKTIGLLGCQGKPNTQMFAYK